MLQKAHTFWTAPLLLGLRVQSPGNMSPASGKSVVLYRFLLQLPDFVTLFTQGGIYVTLYTQGVISLPCFLWCRFCRPDYSGVAFVDLLPQGAANNARILNSSSAPGFTRSAPREEVAGIRPDSVAPYACLLCFS